MNIQSKEPGLMHKYRWLVAFGVTLAASIALISFLFSNYPTAGSFAYRLLDGFIGNTVSGTILSIIGFEFS